jgi:hypothetical protein
MDDGLTTRQTDEHIDLQKDRQIDIPRSNRQKDRLSVRWSIRQTDRGWLPERLKVNKFTMIRNELYVLLAVSAARC